MLYLLLQTHISASKGEWFGEDHRGREDANPDVPETMVHKFIVLAIVDHIIANEREWFGEVQTESEDADPGVPQTMVHKFIVLAIVDPHHC